MFCTQLSGITNLTDNQRDSFDNFFSQFLNNGYITLSKAAHHTGFDDSLICNTFSELCQKDYLERIYAVQCPECGHFIRKIKDIETFDYNSIDNCYACGEDIEINKSDIIVLYARKGNNPFGEGQHLDNGCVGIDVNVDVAPIDKLDWLISMVESVKIMATTMEKNAKSAEEGNREQMLIMENAQNTLSKNKIWSFVVVMIFKVIVGFIMIWILWISKLKSNVASIFTVLTYVISSLIEPAIRNMFPTDYAELERKEKISRWKRKNNKVQNKE